MSSKVRHRLLPVRKASAFLEQTDDPQFGDLVDDRFGFDADVIDALRLIEEQDPVRTGYLSPS